MLQKMFPKEGERVPEIRFPGFEGDWECHRLGEVTEFIRNGYNYKADGDRNHRYKITRIESISSGTINIERLGSSENINESYKLKNGDILFSHINSLPYIANTAIYTNDLGEMYHGMNLLNIRVKYDIIEPFFLLHLLKNENSRQWFRIMAKPAVNQVSISTIEVGAFEFLMPKIEEQTKIAKYFTTLDNLISITTQELNEYKRLKKCMLQKMFC
jgi:type I restriction enzyme S subunit